MSQLTIDLSGITDAIDSMIEQVRGGYSFGRMRDAGEASVRLYAGEEQARFMDASHGSGEWADLASSTKKKRYRQAGNKGRMPFGIAAIPFPILYITGELYSSFTPGAPQNVLDYQTDLIVYGTSVFHAVFHQSGTRTEPQRAMLVDPSPQILQQMAEFHASALSSGLPQSFSVVSINPLSSVF